MFALSRRCLLSPAVIVFALLLGCAPSNGQGQTSDVKKAATKAPRVKATNLLELRKHVGKSITAYGRVDRIGKSGSGHRFVNFAGGQLSAICRKENVRLFQGAAALEHFRGKDVELSGKLENYKGKLQIVLAQPSQIRLATSAPAVGPKVELKQIGKNSWLSPAGLRYTGLDPQGRTRVEHVMRHAEDDPNRPGPHGVFDANDQASVFGVIDEAWKLAKKRRTKPNQEGRRATYTVSMGRRIGYLGGQTGRSRGKPALSRIFIVFETGTNNIITAFPK